MEYKIILAMDKNEKKAKRKFKEEITKEIKRGWKIEGLKSKEIKTYKTAKMYIISQVIKK